MKCEFCGSELLRGEEGLICSSCGAVFQDFQEGYEITGGPLARRESEIIDYLSSYFNVPMTIAEEAKKVANIVKKELGIEKAPASLEVAAFIYACRREGRLIPLSEIDKLAKKERMRISTSTVALYIAKISSILGRSREDLMVPYLNYVKVKIMENESIMKRMGKRGRYLVEVAEQLAYKNLIYSFEINRGKIAGRNPILLAATAYYNALKLLGANITQREVASCVGIGKSAIAKGRRVVIGPVVMRREEI
ncbi:MAG: hypothetical protein ACP5JF_03825 [Candidatus Methanodesulfokora sp.]|jgi:transcription initiation factor TFIIIB Brf1 subunit/transcription initiation factor TFIIB